MADGPAGFTRGSTCPALLRESLCFGRLRVRSFHALRPDFPDRSTRRLSCNLAPLQPPPGRNRGGLGSSPVARHYWGNHFCFLFLRVLRCFSSPGSPPAQAGWQSVRLPGCPIRTSGGHRSPAPRPGFSQLAASFIAFQSHRHPPCALSFFRRRHSP